MEAHPTDKPKASLTISYNNIETGQDFVLTFLPHWDAELGEIVDILKSVLYVMGYDRHEIEESFPNS